MLCEMADVLGPCPGVSGKRWVEENVLGAEKAEKTHQGWLGRPRGPGIPPYIIPQCLIAF